MVSTKKYCEYPSGDWDEYFLEFAIATPLFLILFVLLFINTMYHEYKLRDDTKYIKVLNKIRISFILLQLIAMYWILNDLFRLVIDPFTLSFRGNIMCQIAAYSPKIVPPLFYSVYLYQILLRLIVSFKGSYLALNNTKIYAISTIVFIPIILSSILFFILNDHEPCQFIWKPADLKIVWKNNENFSICGLEMNQTVRILASIASVWIALSNILFAIIFGVKLYKVITNHVDNVQKKYRLKSLIFKISLLTLIGAISTVLNYFLWLFNDWRFGVTFLYLDLFINCMVIALMFKYNDKWFKRCCKCCIWMFHNKYNVGINIEDTVTYGANTATDDTEMNIELLGDDSFHMTDDIHL